MSCPEAGPRSSEGHDVTSDPQIWIAFLTLLALEIVLGTDNVVQINPGRQAPEHQRARARTIGLLLELVMRINLLFSLSWIIGLTGAPAVPVAAVRAGPSRGLEHATRHLPRPDPRLELLTDKETDVLRAMADGASNAEIGRRLFLGEATVKTHVGRILRKLQLRDRTQAVIWAHRTGLVDP